jgi:hypothetical protein
MKRTIETKLAAKMSQTISEDRVLYLLQGVSGEEKQWRRYH